MYSDVSDEDDIICEEESSDDEYCQSTLHYGRNMKEKKPNKKTTEEKAPKPPKKQRATEADLEIGLYVTNIDLNIEKNTKSHRTDEYACTEADDKEDDENDKEDAELVLRRGGNFALKITFQRPYDCDKDDIELVFQTGGCYAKHNKCTNAKFLVNESEKVCEANDWAGTLVATSGNSATVDVHIAANCAIGQWSIAVKTFVMNDGKKQQRVYTHDQQLYVVFNPWCKDDTTYMPDDSLLDEYVLNESGYVYKGSDRFIEKQNWFFGQFEDGVLEAAFHLLYKCTGKKKVAKLSNPIAVARIIAQMVNSCDGDGGVLTGRWIDNYSDGKKPTSWYSSVQILRQYMWSKKPVKYGQCWVFSAVATTVCRALGLPARSVTNYESAHDTDTSCTIDIYWKQEKDEDGWTVLKQDESKTNDSVWNFHVWNEVWLQRPDIPVWGEHPNGCFDGWQVIDATPQETSGGIFTCGPSPLYAIKRGLVTIPHDTAFVFAEVNADKLTWHPTPTGEFKLKKVRPDAIGHKISTKQPGTLERLDLTDSYKFLNDLAANKKAKLAAALTRDYPGSDEYLAFREKKQPVVFKLIHRDDLIFGEDLVVRLTATHDPDRIKKSNLDLPVMTFVFHNRDYKGQIEQIPFLKEQQPKKCLKPNEECVYEFTLQYNRYKYALGDDRCMSIQALGQVFDGRKFVQFCCKRHDVVWQLPKLDVKLPASVAAGTMFQAVVKYKNSLPVTLRNGWLCYESNRRVTCNDSMILLDNVPGESEFEVQVYLRARKPCSCVKVMFTFRSKELTCVDGLAEMEVTEPK